MKKKQIRPINLNHIAELKHKFENKLNLISNMPEDTFFYQTFVIVCRVNTIKN
jgi:hypothetical protein